MGLGQTRSARMDHTVRFYFSFRSPYAWLAAERWQIELGDLSPVVERIPFYPTRETFPNDPTLLPSKYRYVAQDVRRLAHEYGLSLRPPHALDTDWERAHAAFLGVQAAQPERAEAFMLEMFRARFSRSLDLAVTEVIAEAATRAGADPSLANEAAAAPALQQQVAESFVRGQQRDGIFGAPSFVYQEQLFWGHDRMHHLKSALRAGQRAHAPATNA
jgi:2-hydroxychromene-2-carboxylate isomerase